MMAWFHAAIGASLGSATNNRAAAFGLGALSHIAADLFPHRDYDLPVEAPLALAALAAIGLRYGWNSPELAGALGGIAPDVENGLEILGLIPSTVGPTHTTQWWFIGHGRRIESPLTQVIGGLVCLAILELRRRR